MMTARPPGSFTVYTVGLARNRVASGFTELASALGDRFSPRLTSETATAIVTRRWDELRKGKPTTLFHGHQGTDVTCVDSGVNLFLLKDADEEFGEQLPKGRGLAHLDVVFRHSNRRMGESFQFDFQKILPPVRSVLRDFRALRLRELLFLTPAGLASTLTTPSDDHPRPSRLCRREFPLRNGFTLQFFFRSGPQGRAVHATDRLVGDPPTLLERTLHMPLDAVLSGSSEPERHSDDPYWSSLVLRLRSNGRGRDAEDGTIYDSGRIQELFEIANQIKRRSQHEWLA